MLQIGGEAHAGGGWRPWMQIGTYYASKLGADNMYVGLKEVAPDRNEAIISWGNNPSNNPFNADKLRFIFTGAPNNGPASTVNGLEIGRMWANNNGDGRMGIGDFFTAGTDPANTLEIMASPASPYWNLPGGASGLRFTHLKSTATAIPNPGTGVLSVDVNGDVIYVPGGGGGGGGTIGSFGNACGTTQNPLTANTELPLGGFNFNFTENALTPSSVLIGFPTCSNIIPTRFGVYNDIHTAAGYFESSTASMPIVLGIHTTATNTGGRATGIDAIVASSGGSHSIAVSARAYDATLTSPTHIGVDAHAANATSQSFAVNGDVVSSSSPFNYGYQTEIKSGTNPTAISYGVHSTISNPGAINYAGYFMATGAGTNYGIFSSALPGSNQTPPVGPNYAGFFDGDVIRTGSDNFSSDVNLKQNIQPITNATAIIQQLTPKNYFFNHTVHPNMVLPSGKQWGLIAQDVEQVLPELVSDVEHPAQYDSLGNLEYAAFTFKTLNYQAFTGILIQAVKEQKSAIDSLKTTNDSLIIINNKQDSIINNLNDRLSHLENCLSGILPILCQMSHQAIQTNSPEVQQAIRSQLAVYLQNKEAIILDQNVPNPFAEQTVINFSIPESVKSAQIFFYDGMGKLIKTVDIRERGLGSITVFGADLSSGTYMYTLVADGVNVATKKMVKE